MNDIFTFVEFEEEPIMFQNKAKAEFLNVLSKYGKKTPCALIEETPKTNGNPIENKKIEKEDETVLKGSLSKFSLIILIFSGI